MRYFLFYTYIVCLIIQEYYYITGILVPYFENILKFYIDLDRLYTLYFFDSEFNIVLFIIIKALFDFKSRIISHIFI